MATKAVEAKTITFSWIGTNKSGHTIRGEMAAPNVSILKAELRRQGITPKKVKRKGKSLFSNKNSKITSSDITLFIRQLSTMLNAGVPLDQSFDIMAKGTNNVALANLLQTVKNDIESGNNLSDALKKHPEHFNEFVCNLIQAGEASGSLDTMLSRIATYKEKMESLRKKVKKALMYPGAVLVVAFGVTIGLLVFVVPQFAAIFESFGAELPAMTQFIIMLSEGAQKYWWMVALIIVGFVIWFKRMMKKSEKFAFKIDVLTLKLPIIGIILKKATIARFARTLATTFAAGMPLVDALECVAGAAGNRLYEKGSLNIREEVATGTQIQTAMRNTELFPTMVIQMVRIGEESGSLETMLSKVAEFYEEDVDHAVDSLSSLLEPLIMVILGVLVGGLLVAMYLPIFQLGSVI